MLLEGSLRFVAMTERKKNCAENPQNLTSEAAVYIHPEESSEKYYSRLGLSPEASSAEIRRAYYSLCRKHHPDKVSSGCHQSEELLQIQEAYKLLSDDAKRILWDLKHHIYCPEEAERKLVELQELQHLRTERDRENMQIEYAEKVRKENTSDGVVVLCALYGNLSLSRSLLDKHYTGIIEEQHLEGPYVDVTVPLQCHIDDSRFVFAGGASSSFEQLRGFYNPAPLLSGSDVALYVLYRFRGHLHEVTVSDCSKLTLPLRSHLCLSDTPRGPYAASNAKTTREDNTAVSSARWRWGFFGVFSVGLACSAIYLYINPQSKVEQLLQQLLRLKQQHPLAAVAISSLSFPVALRLMGTIDRVSNNSSS